MVGEIAPVLGDARLKVPPELCMELDMAVGLKENNLQANGSKRQQLETGCIPV